MTFSKEIASLHNKVVLKQMKNSTYSDKVTLKFIVCY